MRIYLTHCCAKKDDSLRTTGVKVTPEELYVATPTRRFMNSCKERSVAWAILSDKYGVWFPDVKHKWYDKHPDTVTPEEFERLVNDFDENLDPYDEIWFYYNPGRFHPLYDRLLTRSSLEDRITRFTHISEIV